MRKLISLSLIVLFGSASGFTQKRPDVSLKGENDPFQIATGTSFYASKDAAPTTAPAPNAPEINNIVADLAEALEVIRKNHEAGDRLNYNGITKSSIESALRSLDPHSNYFDAAEYRDLLEEEQSEYSGIGATIMDFRRGGQIDTFVVDTFPGSPAALAKLKFGDRIIKVNGQDFTGSSSDDVRNAVRGASGTKVRLLVEKAATGRTETVELRRNIVPQPSVRDAFVLPGGVGYVDMAEGFNYTTADELAAALKQLHRQGVNARPRRPRTSRPRLRPRMSNSLSYGWQLAVRAPEIPGLSLTRPVAVAPGGDIAVRVSWLGSWPAVDRTRCPRGSSPACANFRERRW